MATKTKTRYNFLPCIPKFLSEKVHGEGIISHSAKQAIAINPINRPNPEHIISIIKSNKKDYNQKQSNDLLSTLIHPDYLAIITTKYWGAAGVNLSVGFMESIDSTLRNKILAHMNVWGEYANVKIQYTESLSFAHIRLTRDPAYGGGYWSYLGTDILSIPKNQPTMSLQDFTMSIPDSEFMRVIPHETGHSLGCPHEHLRPDLINLLDPNKTVRWFQQHVGWNPQITRQQVLTPLDESSLLAPTPSDQLSIMCYQLSGECTKSGNPIIGGATLSDWDKKYIALHYPKSNGGTNPDGGTNPNGGTKKPPVGPTRMIVVGVNKDNTVSINVDGKLA